MSKFHLDNRQQGARTLKYFCRHTDNSFSTFSTSSSIMSFVPKLAAKGVNNTPNHVYRYQICIVARLERSEGQIG